MFALFVFGTIDFADLFVWMRIYARFIMLVYHIMVFFFLRKMGKTAEVSEKQSALPIKFKRSVCKPGRHLARLSEKQRALVCNKQLLQQLREKLNDIERQRQTNAEGCTTPDVNTSSLCASMRHMSLD